MNFLFRPDQDRLHQQDSWKKSAYSFIPGQTHFGDLLALADDKVGPAQGFGMHGHKNMEITTLVIEGEQIHKDNVGNQATIGPNRIQTMSAGTGIQHSEYNASAAQSFRSLQVWIYPKVMNVRPRHETISYQPADKLNRILLVVSPDRSQTTALINQDAFFSVLTLEKDKRVYYDLNRPGNGVYIHCVTGKITIDRYELGSGDALGVYDTEGFDLAATIDADIVFVEVPMTKGITV